MRLGQRYGKDRLEAACRRSLRYGLGDYQSVKNILVGNLDRLPEEQPAEAPQGQTPVPLPARPRDISTTQKRRPAMDELVTSEAQAHAAEAFRSQ